MGVAFPERDAKGQASRLLRPPHQETDGDRSRTSEKLAATHSSFSSGKSAKRRWTKKKKGTEKRRVLSLKVESAQGKKQLAKRKLIFVQRGEGTKHRRVKNGLRNVDVRRKVLQNESRPRRARGGELSQTHVKE